MDGGPDRIYFEMAAHANRMAKKLREGLAEMTAFAISKFWAKTLYGRVMHGNDASVKVLEKNGYRFLEEEFGAEDDPYGNGMRVYVYDARA